jgi:NTE family protein
LAGRSLGIVLSGGGARALAHLGVLEELRAAGLKFDRADGVSLGSLIAAATAADFTPADMFDVFERSFVSTNPSNDFVPPAYSLIRGAKTRRLLYDAFGDRRIEELPLRCLCLSCDLVAREAVLHRTGPAARVHADLVVAPRVDSIGLTDWKALGHVRELGRRAAREALAADPDLRSRPGI